MLNFIMRLGLKLDWAWPINNETHFSGYWNNISVQEIWLELGLDFNKPNTYNLDALVQFF